MSAPALIGLDWGTTSLRAYLLDRAGQVLEERASPAGILAAATEGFEAVLEREVGPWLAAEPGLPVLAAGMIGSRQGWQEVPYLPCPAGAVELAAALVPVATAAGRRLHFVPGLAGRNAAGLPDVLRGEETQILGALTARPAARLLVLPGTHSKWARLEAGQVTGFSTFMTGEVYAVMLRHSILGRLAEGEAPDAAAFARGVTTGQRDDPAAGGLLMRLFSVRVLPLLGELPAGAVASYLSGLLLGSELREATRGLAPELLAEGVVLVGAAALVERYAAACRIAGVPAVPAEPDAAARGLHRIALDAGLLA